MPRTTTINVAITDQTIPLTLVYTKPGFAVLTNRNGRCPVPLADVTSNSMGWAATGNAQALPAEVQDADGRRVITEYASTAKDAAEAWAQVWAYRLDAWTKRVRRESEAQIRETLPTTEPKMIKRQSADLSNVNTNPRFEGLDLIDAQHQEDEGHNEELEAEAEARGELEPSPTPAAPSSPLPAGAYQEDHEVRGVPYQVRLHPVAGRSAYRIEVLGGPWTKWITLGFCQKQRGQWITTARLAEGDRQLRPSRYRNGSVRGLIAYHQAIIQRTGRSSTPPSPSRPVTPAAPAQPIQRRVTHPDPRRLRAQAAQEAPTAPRTEAEVIQAAQTLPSPHALRTGQVFNLDGRRWKLVSLPGDVKALEALTDAGSTVVAIIGAGALTMVHPQSGVQAVPSAQGLDLAHQVRTATLIAALWIR